MGFIYQIRNTVNGKCYIGQTRQRWVSQRWNDHKKNKMSVISQAFASHGLDKFEFSVICEIPNEELNYREVKEIAERRTLAPNGYNLQTGGNAYEQSEETKRKIGAANSIALRGKTMPEKTREALKKANIGRRFSKTDEQKERDREARKASMKPVDQYTLDGAFMKTWESVRATGVNRVRDCCSLRQSQAGGFVWRWRGEPFDAEPPEEQIEALKKKAREYREKNRERINAWKRAYALKLRAEAQECGRHVIGDEDDGATSCQARSDTDIHTDVVGSG
jgi:group I intron endonuclease